MISKHPRTERHHHTTSLRTRPSVHVPPPTSLRPRPPTPVPPPPSASFAAQLDAVIAQHESRLAELRSDVEKVNKARRLQQTAAGHELASLDEQLREAVRAEREVRGAVEELRARVKRAREEDGEGDGAGDGAVAGNAVKAED